MRQTWNTPEFEVGRCTLQLSPKCSPTPARPIPAGRH